MAFIRTVSDSEESRRCWTLRHRITSIGTDADDDLQMTGDGVVAEHAAISCDGARFTIRPLHSNAAVKVNGDDVSGSRVLEHGDEIQLGETDLEFLHLREPVNRHGELTERDRRRLEGLEHIHRLSVELLGATDLEELLEQVVDSTIALTDAAKGFLLLVGDDGWEIQVARHVDPDTVIDGDEALSDSVLQHVLETRQPLVVADARNDEQFRDSQSVINLELCSVMCVPLLDHGELLGAIYVGNNQVTDLFDQLDLELLSIFAAQLSLVVSNAILLDNLRTDKRQLEKCLEHRRFGNLIGASEAMQPVFHAIDRVAPTDITVLITGETGTGKELVAGELHQRSERSDGPFVTLNCGAIPANLLESELFGHIKGAFTGADDNKEGKFHAADGGTIFLDEIGEMPHELQVKLLRVLQERTVSRVGSNEQEHIDIRVIAATNRNLLQHVESGEFREDLYYRLNVVEVAIPPLRDRGDDIVLIARYLIDKLSEQLDVVPRELSSDAIQALRKHDWPGNVRQLENHLKKALVLADGATINPRDLDLPDETLPEVKPLARAKEEFALEYVLEILERNDGNRSQTARDLDVDPRTIFRYLEKESP